MNGLLHSATIGFVAWVALSFLLGGVRAWACWRPDACEVVDPAFADAANDETPLERAA
jgi:hypothetical protein